MKAPKTHLRRVGAGLVFGALFAFAAHAGTPPANDNFSGRTVLAGRAIVVSTPNRDATSEPGDPRIGPLRTTRSLWWSWTAPYTGWASFSTTGSSSPVVVGVFLGDSLPTLSALGASVGTTWLPPFYSANDPMTLRSGDVVNVPVRSGETYQIVVGVNGAFADTPPSPAGRVVLGINQSPTILSAGRVEGRVGDSLSHQITATNGATEYEAENLPAGLSLNPFTGQISGVPSVAGTFDVAISARAPGGLAGAVVRFAIEPADPTPRAPEFTSGSARNVGSVGRELSAYFFVKNNATSLTADPLPPGLTITYTSSTSLNISGTPTEAGTFRTTLRASNEAGSVEAVTTFQIDEKPPLPLTDSNAAAYGKVGTSFSYSFSDNVYTYPPDTSYAVSSLPPGLQISGTSISGTPTEAGTFEVPVTATNAAGSTPATLTIVIDPASDPTPPEITGPPVITGPSATIFSLGAFSSYQVRSNDPATQFSARGLPEGLSINPTTGVISGSTQATGSFAVTIIGTNAFGTTETPLTLSAQRTNTFLLGSSASATGVVNRPFSYTFTIQTDSSWFYLPPRLRPDLIIAPGALPAGLTFTPQPSSSYPSYPYFYQPLPAGRISGTPRTTGTFRVPVSAYYNGGRIDATLTIEVRPGSLAPPEINSNATAQGEVGSYFSYYGSALNDPTFFSATGLPPGLTINSVTGNIEGRPTAQGTFVVSYLASNAAGASRAKVTIFIAPPQRVTFSSSATTEGTVGADLSVSSGYYNPPGGTVSFTATGLPPGLQFSPTDGLISGRPTTPGTYPVTITATNAGGASRVVRTFVIRAVPLPPVFTGSLAATATVGEYFNHRPSAAGTSPTYGAGSLPPGLTWSGSSIEGTPTEAGTFEIPLTATNAGGTTRVVLTLRVGPPKAPRVFSEASLVATQGTQSNYWLYPAGPVTSASIRGAVPAGMTFDPATKRLSVTPTQTGTFPIEIDLVGPGGSTTTPFTLIVGPAVLPPVFYDSVIEYHPPGGYSYISVGNNPTSIRAQGVPAGLTFRYDGGTYASLTGTLPSSASYPIEIIATNSAGTRSQVVTLTGNETLRNNFGRATATATRGEAFRYDFYSGNAAIMADRRYSAEGLPPGLSMDPASGQITGTPTAAGDYPVRIAATRAGSPDVSGTVKILVRNGPDLPTVGSQSYATGTVGLSFSYTLYANGTATTYAMENLPPGLSFDPANRRLSGIPTSAGFYRLNATVGNAGGSRSAAVFVEIAPSRPAPEFSGAAGIQAFVGENLSASISASNSPTSYEAIGLPAGLTLNSSSGGISGVPAATGRYPVVVRATNSGGTTSAQLTIDVLPQRVPLVTSALERSATVGDSGSFSISTSVPATSFSASNLPPGLSLNPPTGTITGAPTAPGDYRVQVTATNAAGTGTASITWRVRPRAPSWITSDASVPGFVGESLSYSLRFSGGSSNAIVSAGNLPPGLTLSRDDNRIVGTPTIPGRYEALLSVYGDGGQTRSVVTFDIATLASSPPVINSPLTALALVGSSFRLPIAVANGSTLISASPLPPGLRLDAVTRELVGVPRTVGTHPITLTAANAAGESTATITLVSVTPPLPVVTSPNTMTAPTGQEVNLPVDIRTGNPSSWSYSPFNPSFPRPTSFPLTVTARGLPPGLFLDPQTNTIKGTATQGGSYRVELTAATAMGDAISEIVLHLAEPPFSPTGALKVASGRLNVFGARGSAFSGDLWSSGPATAFVSSALPPGLTLEKTTGSVNGEPALGARIAGIPEKAGVYPVTVTFSNATHSAKATLTIVIPENPERPDFSGRLAASGTRGKDLYYYIGEGARYALNNAATSFAVSGLPGGLTLETSYGYMRITGRPTEVGRFPATISLTNAGGTSETTVTFFIVDAPASMPRLSNADGGAAQAGQVAYTDEEFRWTVGVEDDETDLAVDNLPAGLRLEKTASRTWTISGRPSESGPALLLLTATNPAGTITQPFTLDVRNLDQRIPDPTPTPTPGPEPSATPSPRPQLIFDHPARLFVPEVTTTLRGRVLHFDRSASLLVRRNQGKWTRVRADRNGQFSLRIESLPAGRTIIRLKLTDANGRASTRHVRIIRPALGIPSGRDFL